MSICEICGKVLAYGGMDCVCIQCYKRILEPPEINIEFTCDKSSKEIIEQCENNENIKKTQEILKELKEHLKKSNSYLIDNKGRIIDFNSFDILKEKE